MSTFKDYLTESAKSYDYKIKVAGELEEGFANKLESALAKFEVAKLVMDLSWVGKHHNTSQSAIYMHM